MNFNLVFFAYTKASKENDKELAELIEQFRSHLFKLLDMLDVSDPTIVKLKRSLNLLPASNLADIGAAIIRASHQEKLEIFDTVDLVERFKKVLPLLVRQIEVS